MLPSTYMDCYMVEPSIVQRGVDGYTQLFFEAQGKVVLTYVASSDTKGGKDVTNPEDLNKKAKKSKCATESRVARPIPRAFRSHICRREE